MAAVHGNVITTWRARMRDYLEQASDTALLEEKPRVSPALLLYEQIAWSEGEWHVLSAQMRLARCLQYAGNVDLRLIGLLEHCDGRRTLGLR